MDEWVAFLKARLAEDETAAKKAMEFGDGVWALAPHFHTARHDPARVLREVEAKRAIVERYERGAAGELPEWKAGRELIVAALAILAAVLRDLAAVWTGHPDYPGR